METPSVHPRTKVANKASEVSLVIIALVIIGVLYMLFWPFKVIAIKENPMPIITKVVAAGDYATHKFTVTKYGAYPCVLSKMLIVSDTGSVIYIGTVGSNVDRLGTWVQKGRSLIPEYTPPGKYHIRIEAVYSVNPLRKMSFVFVTEKFEVTNDVLAIQQDIAKHGKRF